MAFCTSSEPSVVLTMSEPMQKHTPDRINLEKVLRDKKARNTLIISLGKTEAGRPSVRPLRYVIAADEYLQVRETVERKQKARKMVGVFVQNGSMFQLQDLPSDMQTMFVKEKYQVIIPQAREHYSKLLALDDGVKQAIKDLNML